MTGENTNLFSYRIHRKDKCHLKKNSRRYNRLFEGEEYSISKGQLALRFKQDQNMCGRNSFTQPHGGIRCLT